jgi:hypothetical protein
MDEIKGQKVQVVVKASGDYVAFHEMGIWVVFDITNNIQMDDYTLEQLQNWEYKGSGYSDVTFCEAYLIGSKYYIDLRSL